MDVLLIGSTGSLMRKMVEKLHKEGHRIFVLTEEGRDTFFSRKVFETYRFAYDNACIREVFVSVKPQVTLFLGAYDKIFPWKTGMNTSIKFSSGLLNLLMSFSALRQGRFIYLSSEEALEGFEVSDDGEVVRSKNASEKAQSIAMLSYIDPVTALLLSALILREPLSAAGLAGAVMIIGSAIAAEWRRE